MINLSLQMSRAIKSKLEIELIKNAVIAAQMCFNIILKFKNEFNSERQFANAFDCVL